MSKATDQPGLSDLLKEGLDKAFAEDKMMLEAQQLRLRENPDFKPKLIAADAGPTRILAVLNKLLKEKALEGGASHG